MCKNILITGVEGFIASNLYNKLKDTNHVIGIDNGINSSIYSDVKGIRINIGDKELLKIMLDNDIDVVYSIASRISVDESLNEREQYYHNNVDCFRSFLETIVEYEKITKTKLEIIHASSSEVYGSNILPGTPMTTNHPTNPMSHYALTKLYQEELLRLYKRLYGIRIKIQRFFNIFGPMQSDLAFIPKAIKSALYKVPIYIYGNGHQKRSYTPVDSVTDEYIRIMNNFDTELSNFGDPTTHTINEIAEYIYNKINNTKNANIKYIEPRISEVTELLPECNNYKYDIKFWEYLDKTIDFYKESL